MKTLNSNLAGHPTKKPEAKSYNKCNWWINPYLWTHGVGCHGGEAFFIRADGHKDKAAYLNRMSGRKRVITEGGLHEGSNKVKNNVKQSLINNDNTNEI